MEINTNAIEKFAKVCNEEIALLSKTKLAKPTNIIKNNKNIVNLEYDLNGLIQQSTITDSLTGNNTVKKYINGRIRSIKSNKSFTFFERWKNGKISQIETDLETGTNIKSFLVNHEGNYNGYRIVKPPFFGPC